MLQAEHTSDTVPTDHYMVSGFLGEWRVYVRCVCCVFSHSGFEDIRHLSCVVLSCAHLRRVHCIAYPHVISFTSYAQKLLEIMAPRKHSRMQLLELACFHLHRPLEALQPPLVGHETCPHLGDSALKSQSSRQRAPATTHYTSHHIGPASPEQTVIQSCTPLACSCLSCQLCARDSGPTLELLS